MKKAKKCNTLGTTYVLKICEHSVTAGLHNAGVANVQKGRNPGLVEFPYIRGPLVNSWKKLEGVAVEWFGAVTFVPFVGCGEMLLGCVTVFMGAVVLCKYLN